MQISRTAEITFSDTYLMYSEQQNQLFINIKQDTENNSQSVIANNKTKII